ncbi:12123_t:CDS:2, partial [Dentiscutata erythropus]
STPDPYAESATALLRLTPEGSSYFNWLNDKSGFFNQLLTELADVIPVDPSRLSSSNRFQEDYLAPTKQLLLSFNIEATRNQSQRNTLRVISDLNTLIINKQISPISNRYNLTFYLDDSYGCQNAHIEALTIINSEFAGLGMFKAFISNKADFHTGSLTRKMVSTIISTSTFQLFRKIDDYDKALHFDNNFGQLHSCVQVDHEWSRMVTPLLWSKPGQGIRIDSEFAFKLTISIIMEQTRTRH